MKPRLQEYHVASTLDEAVELLAEYRGDCRIIAGGQSLVPMMNLRLTRFAHLVDINRIEDLRLIELDGTLLSVGAAVRQRELEQFLRERGLHCLLLKALSFVGHPATRNRGTVVGSLAHADPAAELPVAHSILSGSIRVRGAGSEREVAAPDFYVGPFETVLAETEIAVSAHFELADTNDGVVGVFDEVSIRHGDFALVMVGVVSSKSILRVGLGNMDGRPLVIDFDGASVYRPEDVVTRMLDLVDPQSDIHASAAYRSKAARVLIHRALASVAAERNNENEVN
jgi:CO/xanthine dehydrogenase FAD-binding subunit